MRNMPLRYTKMIFTTTNTQHRKTNGPQNLS